MGYGLLMTIQTPWGVGPWDVLHLGLARQLGITVGRANQLAGAAIILLILLLRGRTLTVVTVLNVITIGWWMDRFSAWGLVPYVDGWPGLLFLAAGIVVMGFGVALYLHPGQGAGPRDGLMVTLHERTGQPLYRIKIAMDLCAGRRLAAGRPGGHRHRHGGLRARARHRRLPHAAAAARGGPGGLRARGRAGTASRHGGRPGRRHASRG